MFEGIAHRKQLRTQELAPSHEEIERHVVVILGSPAFKSSPKSQEFLRFVVERCLAGQVDALHERAIGIDLLGKDPGFDPSEDASVRVKANEVRKRLTRFYETPDGVESLRVDLPVGSYVPQFRRISFTTTPEAFRPRRKLWALLAAAVLCVVFTCLAMFWYRQSPNSELDALWHPVFADSNPIILCLPGLRGLRPQPGTDLARMLLNTPTSAASGEDPVLPAGNTDLYVHDDFVGMGASIGALRMAGFLGRKGKSVLPRVCQDVSFADLRSHPAVLLGGPSSSRWTLEMNQEMPFIFSGDGGGATIAEARPPKRSWSAVHPRRSGRADEDYAIVGRVANSRSGQIVLIAAGITTFGTESAAECLVEGDCIARLTARAPRDWASRNFEAVIHTRILGNTPGPSQVVAVQFW
jgi:hypothetical protein